MQSADEQRYAPGQSTKTARSIPPRRPFRGFLIVLFSMYALLLWRSAWIHSPTHLEVFHLPAGVAHLRLGRFDLCRVNPPLVRLVAAVAAEASGFCLDTGMYDADPHHRSEYSVGLDCMYANDVRILRLTSLARCACIPFVLIGGWTCFVWAKQLYGALAGMVAALLWCSCPYFLGHGSLMTPDAHAAGIGVAAIFVLRRWLKVPTWTNALAAGSMLGLAELCKFTLLIFYPLLPIVWVVYRLPEWKLRLASARTALGEGAMLVGICIISVLIVNCGYLFEGSFGPLGRFRFQSELLSGFQPLDDAPLEGSSRFPETWLGRLPVPLPANMVQGIDTQRCDFEQGIPSYLREQWSDHGWWYYYLYALSVKLPLGTWVLLGVAVGLTVFTRGDNAPWREEVVVLVPGLVLLLFVSSQTGFSIHSRYVIPALPYFFIWTSKVGRVLQRSDISYLTGATYLMVVVALAWSIGSSLWIYPHSLGYYNELVDGPAEGFRHLAKSDCSWGQDLLFLEKWLDQQPENLDLKAALCGPFDPRLAGFGFTLPARGPRHRRDSHAIVTEDLGPKPGWFAIDVSFLLGGDPLSAADGKGDWEEPSKISGYDLSYFQRFEPTAKAGYSINIYRITLEEANRVRRELGLPELSVREVGKVSAGHNQSSVVGLGVKSSPAQNP